MPRPKKSINVLQAEGKSHMTKSEIEARKQEEAAITPKSDKLEYPDWLTDKVARKEYRRLSKELSEINIFTNLDTVSLAQYCLAYSNFLSVTKEMEKDDFQFLIPQTNKSGATNMIENPLIRIHLKYSDEMKKLASQMGLNVSSRLKLIVPTGKDTKPKNKFDKYANE